MLYIGKNTSSRDTIITVTTGAAALQNRYLKASAAEHCRPIPSALFLAATVGVLASSTFDQETNIETKITVAAGLVGLAGGLVSSMDQGDCRHPQKIAVLLPVAIVGFGAYYFASKWLSGREFWPASCTGHIGCPVHRVIPQDHTEDGRPIGDKIKA